MARASASAQGQDGGTVPAPGSQSAGSPAGGDDPQGQDSGKIKIAQEDLNNGKILLSNGSLAKFNAEGIAEIEAGEATRLLSIPGYKKV
jgi:hypothetical protein